MRRQLHRLEEKLDYAPHEIECVSARKLRHSFYCLWKITASPWWRQSTPMFSFLLGEIRRYYRTKKQGTFLRRFLLQRILEKKHPKEIFGEDRTKSWRRSGGFRASYGRSRFEAKVKAKKELQEILGVKKTVSRKGRQLWKVE
jgi:hypothetical protein